MHLTGDDICLVSSSGGHLELMQALRPVFQGMSPIWVTPKSPKAEALKEAGERVWLIPGWDRANARVGTVVSGVSPALRIRPKLVVSTGAGNTVPFCLASKTLGAHLIFVETMARIRSPSRSGQILHRAASSVFVQWPEMSRVYPGAKVCRPLLLERLEIHRLAEREGTLVMVGTHNEPFERLLRTVEDATRSGVLPQPVVVQRGPARFQSPSFRSRPYIAPRDLKPLLRRADVVVCHGGSGAMTEALEWGKRPIVIPRRSPIEHVDDHQVEAAAKFAQLGLAVVVDDRPISAVDVERARDPVEPPTFPSDQPSLVPMIQAEVARTLERPI